jgi:Arc/MetJ family transcription regulator
MRTTIDVDKRAAAAAAKVLNTRSLKDTVNAALHAVIGAQLRRRLVERIRGKRLPAPTPEELAQLRKPKVPVGALSRPR